MYVSMEYSTLRSTIAAASQDQKEVLWDMQEALIPQIVYFYRLACPVNQYHRMHILELNLHMYVRKVADASCQHAVTQHTRPRQQYRPEYVEYVLSREL